MESCKNQIVYYRRPSKEFHEELKIKKRIQNAKDARKKRLIKKKIFDRDKECIFCSSGFYDNLMDFPNNRLEIHRIKPGKNNGEYILKNCVLVCTEHHRILSDKSNSYIKKWIQPQSIITSEEISESPDLDWEELMEMETGFHIKNPEFEYLKYSMEKYIKVLKRNGWI